MKNILILLLAIGIYSCGNKSPGNTRQSTADSTTHKVDTLNSLWINNFRELRDAVYQNDVNKIKTYFNFPVLNYDNEIWSVVLADSTDIFTGFNRDTIVPFTEKDFNRYYKKLFTKEFINGILKIKSDELFKTNNVYTESFNSDSVTTYAMIASVDKENNTLNLVLSFNTRITDEDGNVDPGEGSIGYTFAIQPDGRLIFKEIRIAG